MKTVLITGASRGIGAAIAKKLNKSYNLVLTYNKNKDKALNLLEKLRKENPNVIAVKCDVKNENEVKMQLEAWAKEIDKYSYQPIEDYDENKEIVDWLNSGDFSVQIIERDFGLVERGRLITSTTAHLISIDNIESLNSDENGIEYYIEAALQFIYELKDGGKTQDTINVGIDVKMLDDATYSVEAAYRTDEDETESES